MAHADGDACKVAFIGEGCLGSCIPVSGPLRDCICTGSIGNPASEATVCQRTLTRLVVHMIDVMNGKRPHSRPAARDRVAKGRGILIMFKCCAFLLAIV